MINWLQETITEDSRKKRLSHMEDYMKKLIIDRFEGNYAICEREDKSTENIPKYKLPLDCKEGDCLVQDADGMIQMDNETTKSREKRIYDKINRLFE